MNNAAEVISLSIKSIGKIQCTASILNDVLNDVALSKIHLSTMRNLTNAIHFIFIISVMIVKPQKVRIMQLQNNCTYHDYFCIHILTATCQFI